MADQNGSDCNDSVDAGDGVKPTLAETLDNAKRVMYFQNETVLLDEGASTDQRSSQKTSSNSSKGSTDRTFNKILEQRHYNQNRKSLDHCIKRAIELLHELVTENKERPIFYPVDAPDGLSHMLNSTKAHLALVKNNQELSGRSFEKSKITEDSNEFELRVLNLNLNTGHSSSASTNIIEKLDKNSVSRLIEEKFEQQVRYLHRLEERVNDTSSKVLVTGDLNAGKSTFCNALLRRKVLPEDQQPCTSVFCEVIDASKENAGVEEVHAVPIGKDYNIRDETTYSVHPLTYLENLVYECDKFSLLKIYVLDRRALEESLLHNGTIDIKLIDAPGLNMDSYQTMQIFSRQEEIDLVVFVVSSENHFTLSAKEFIAAAAAEKQYVFIVVNKFDNIKDKERCIARILDQVKKLSPETYKNAKEFVHFVSSSQVPGGSPDDGGGDSDDDGNNDDRDFDNLDRNLRKFILEKRSLSKLLPAKNYLINLFHDLQGLTDLNQKIYLEEQQKNQKTLDTEINPKFEEMKKLNWNINHTIMTIIEDSYSSIYEHTRMEIYQAIDNFGDKQIIPYPGLSYIYDYAHQTQNLMVRSILSTVGNCEDFARAMMTERVNEILGMARNALQEGFLNEKTFNSELMFSRRRDDIMKDIDFGIDVSDFFDPSLESFLSWLGLSKEFVETSKEHLTLYNPSRFVSVVQGSGKTWRSQVPTHLTLQAVYSSTKILTAGALIRRVYSVSQVMNSQSWLKLTLVSAISLGGLSVYYLISDIPNAFPRKQARKIRKKVIELDYAHKNADRISKECRKVLAFPARQVSNSFQTCIDISLRNKQKIEEELDSAKLSSKYFTNLKLKIAGSFDELQTINLESINHVD